MTETTVRGWDKPGLAKKYHYFDDAVVSLCGRWMLLTQDLDDQMDDHKENCAACKREVAKVRARQAEGVR